MTVNHELLKAAQEALLRSRWRPSPDAVATIRLRYQNLTEQTDRKQEAA